MTNSFKLIGLSVRTTNKDNKSRSDLGQLWVWFFEGDITFLSKIDEEH